MASFRSMGACFGQDLILNLVTRTLRRHFSVAAVTYCDLQTLEAGALEGILSSGIFPKACGRSRGPCRVVACVWWSDGTESTGERIAARREETERHIATTLLDNDRSNDTPDGVRQRTVGWRITGSRNIAPLHTTDITPRQQY